MLTSQLRVRRRFFLAVYCLVVLISPALGGNLLSVDGSTFEPRVAVYPTLSQLEAVPAKLAIEDLLAGENAVEIEWKTASADSLPLYSETPLWYRFRAQNKSAEKLALVLDFPASSTKQLSVFYVRDKQLIKGFHTGSWQPQSLRPVDYSHYAMPLDLEALDTLTVYINTAVTPRRTMSSMRIFAAPDFYAYHAKNEALYGRTMGLGAGIILFSFILLVLLKDIRYIWFVLYALGELLVIALIEGQSTSFLLDYAPLLVPFEVLLYSALSAIGLFLFADTVLNLKENARIGYWLALIAAGCFVFLAAYSLLASLLIDHPFIRFVYLVPMAGVIYAVIVIQGLRQSWRGDAAIRLFTFGILMPALSVFYVAYSTKNHDLVLNTSVMISMILLCIANLLRIGQLKRNEELAVLSSQAKSSFISQLSHEIRNPMNGIIGMSQILMTSELDAENKKSVSIIHQSASSLLSILNDVLDYSKIEAHKMQLERIPFELRSLVMSAANIYTAQCRIENIECEIVIADDLPCHFYGDPNRLTQILSNLLSNAGEIHHRGKHLSEGRLLR